MLEHSMEVSKECKQRGNIPARRICERTIYECKMTPENQSVRVKNVYGLIIKISHARIIISFCIDG